MYKECGECDYFVQISLTEHPVIGECSKMKRGSSERTSGMPPSYTLEVKSDLYEILGSTIKTRHPEYVVYRDDYCVCS